MLFSSVSLSTCFTPHVYLLVNSWLAKLTWLLKSLLTSGMYTEHTGCVIPAFCLAWVGSTWEQSCWFNTRIKQSKKQVTSQTPSAQLCWGFCTLSSSVRLSCWNLDHVWYKSSSLLMGLSCALPRVCQRPRCEFEWVTLSAHSVDSGKVVTYLLYSLKVPSKAQTHTDFFDRTIVREV